MTQGESSNQQFPSTQSTKVSRPSRGHVTSPNVQQARPENDYRQTIQPASPAHRQSSTGFFGTNEHAPQQTYPALQPQGYRESAANYASQKYGLDTVPNAAAHQYGLEPVPATHGWNMRQTTNHPDQLARQYEYQDQVAAGQRADGIQNPVYGHPQHPVHGYPPTQPYMPPQGHFHGYLQGTPQDQKVGQYIQQPYHATSGIHNPRYLSQYQNHSPIANGQENIPNQPPITQAPRAESQHLLVSIIQQLQQLGVISFPGQPSNSTQGQNRVHFGHQQTCPQHGDRLINTSCLQHGHHAITAQKILGTWLSEGSANPSMPCDCIP
jgi:hypothetical protein